MGGLLRLDRVSLLVAADPPVLARRLRHMEPEVQGLLQQGVRVSPSS